MNTPSSAITVANPIIIKKTAVAEKEMKGWVFFDLHKTTASTGPTMLVMDIHPIMIVMDTQPTILITDIYPTTPVMNIYPTMVVIITEIIYHNLLPDRTGITTIVINQGSLIGPQMVTTTTTTTTKELQITVQ